MEQTPRSQATKNDSSKRLLAVVVAVGLAGLGWAGDDTELGWRDTGLPAESPTAPWHHPSMDSATRARLASAFSLAVSRVAGRPECAGLFSDLGADGAEMLTSSLYFPAPAAKRASTCRRAVAFTRVGAAPTFLCDQFHSLTDDHAALVLVHEALHHAGLTESPADPSGKSSSAINEMVRKACGFEVFKKVDRTG
jgi:hypothetical protein